MLIDDIEYVNHPQAPNRSGTFWRDCVMRESVFLGEPRLIGSRETVEAGAWHAGP